MSARNKPENKRARKAERALKGKWVRQTPRVLTGPESLRQLPAEGTAAEKAAEAKRARRGARRLALLLGDHIS